MSEPVVITKAAYLASAVRRDQYPEEQRPAVAFIGRSNVGKSSLINSLTRIRQLAHVSGKPGKTQTINFYELLMRIDGGEERHPVHLVDLPGYGYAKAARESRKTWAKFIEEYFLHAENLHFVCLLLDIRHAPMPSDRKMFEWLVSHDIPVLVIATKADKLGRTARQKQLSLMRRTLDVPDLSILPYSVPKNEGRTELLDVMKEYLLE
ncbi:MULTISPECIES: ribosome biogenesis GTP-binding protein YihA/YsxC [Selenomonas]|uniref:ribosome biogenesis GTP-binding protein YihA/YsxC n=1 Tax=Selenomonas TaxID=970 RepID=UPI0001E0CC41|nr:MULTISPECIES: ribosome biogenesis GTP-binding protein YihA/YsxC [Selenomonas]AKT54427.1 GTP-binding protein [Selenomonas sp. oral taxon 478]AME02836.1 GTP-binding protein [Selenomonas sp. oral taxon 136]EFM23644.1 ribosome biogenesis GTP-binding protein YsxC [Selenomonas sp. oral taxon 149 str. 67H29BP]